MSDNKNCLNCGSELKTGMTHFCSKECMRQFRVKHKEEYDKLFPQKTKASEEKEKQIKFLTQFDKGEGSRRRENNILKIADLLSNGTSETMIIATLRLYFRPSTVSDYMESAKAYLKLKES